MTGSDSSASSGSLLVSCSDSVNSSGLWRGEGFSVSEVISWLLRKTSSLEWSEATSLVIYITVTEMIRQCDYKCYHTLSGQIWSFTLGLSITTAGLEGISIYLKTQCNIQYIKYMRTTLVQ